MSEASRFMVVVEGTSDVQYVQHAVALAVSSGASDPLRVPSGVAAYADERILVCTPGSPGAPHRGGTPQMVRLAKALEPYVFTLEAFGGVLFVFDGDDEGNRAMGQVISSGYAETNAFNLSKAEHPDACGDRGLVIEDLLSLRIQQSFFADGQASCDAVYEEGELKRFRWHHKSKGPLCDHVLANAAPSDLAEVLRLVDRFRHSFGFG